MRLTFVTAASTDRDTDLPLLLDAAREAGIQAEITVWDDPAVRWQDFDLVVVRSCWDYIARREEFLTWTTTVPHLANPADVIAWNTDKSYLRQLAAAGVPVIPTLWDVTPGQDLGPWSEWVVKPTVSAGSKDTARWTTPEQVHAHSADLRAAGRTAMVQPYIASVDDEGETAVLSIGGTFSHAIGKGPLLRPGEGVQQDRDGREVISARRATPAQLAVADAALAAIGPALGATPTLLYSRVDLVTGPDGEPLVIELELTEPSLFLHTDEGAAARLVEAAAAAVRSR